MRATYAAVAIVMAPVASITACGPDGGGGSPLGDSSWTEGTAWRLEGPVVDFGEYAGDPRYEFTSVRTAFQLEDGRIVAANASTPPEVRMYAADGSVDWVSGREGEGPGEFRAILWVARAGRDTLIVNDPWQSRSTLLDLESGTVLDVVNVRSAVPGEVPERVVVLGRFADGAYLGFPNRFFPDGPEDYGVAQTLLLEIDLDGTVIDTIGLVPWVEMVRGSNGTRTIPLFGQNAVAVPYRDSVLHGRPEEYVLHVYGPDGSPARELRRPYVPRPVTDEILAAAEEQELARVRGPEAEAWRTSVARRYREEPRRETLPPYQRVLVDATDHVWVQDYLAPGDASVTWSVFSPQGAFLGQVDMPAAFRLLDVGQERVVGVWQDEFDLQTLRVYDLVKP